MILIKYDSTYLIVVDIIVKFEAKYIFIVQGSNVSITNNVRKKKNFFDLQYLICKEWLTPGFSGGS